MPTELADACTVASRRLMPVVNVASLGPIRFRRFVFAKSLNSIYILYKGTTVNSEGSTPIKLTHLQGHLRRNLTVLEP